MLSVTFAALGSNGIHKSLVVKQTIDTPLVFND